MTPEEFRIGWLHFADCLLASAADFSVKDVGRDGSEDYQADAATTQALERLRQQTLAVIRKAELRPVKPMSTLSLVKKIETE